MRPTSSFPNIGVNPLGGVAGTASVKELLDLVEIDDRASGTVCKCPGELRLEFHGSGREPIVIEFAHGKRLKWSEFPCDAVLTDTSSTTVRRWLNTRARGR